MKYKDLIIKKLLEHNPDLNKEELEKMSKQKVENLLRDQKDKPHREKVLTYIGRDKLSRPVYRDENGSLWKDLDQNSEHPDLYSCDDDINGEPYMSMRHDIKCTFIPERKTNKNTN